VKIVAFTSPVVSGPADETVAASTRRAPRGTTPGSNTLPALLESRSRASIWWMSVTASTSSPYVRPWSAAWRSRSTVRATWHAKLSLTVSVSVLGSGPSHSRSGANPGVAWSANRLFGPVLDQTTVDLPTAAVGSAQPQWPLWPNNCQSPQITGRSVQDQDVRFKISYPPFAPDHISRPVRLLVAGCRPTPSCSQWPVPLR